ncbi:MAG: acetylglutamate kinase [Candidatus Eisenbacteria bacterium]
MSGAPVVIKLGGRALDVPEALDELALDLAALAGRAVIVHGGGGEVSDWCERLGIAARFEGGRRVTDAATLEVAAAVLAGLLNKRLVAQLRARGVDAVGLAALDGGLATVAPHADRATFGEVGVVTAIDGVLVMDLLARGRTPVIASIGQCEGRLLNVNADDLAAALAPALGAAALVLLSDAPGLVLGGEVAPALDLAALDRALQSPEVKGGMAPKLEAARTAVVGGAKVAWIGSWTGKGTLARALAGDEGGTRIARALTDKEAVRG